MMLSNGLVLLIISSAIVAVQASRKEDMRLIKAEQKLRKELLRKYDKTVAPPETTVEVGMVYNCALRNADGSMSLSVMSEYYWSDPRLVWKPLKYRNTSLLTIPMDRMWVPDMTLYNNPAGTTIYPAGVIVNNFGRAVWVLPTIYSEPCSKKDDGDYFCSLRIGSWSYNGFQLNLTESNVSLDISLSDPNCPFYVSDILTTEIQVDQYPCCVEPYPSWLVEFILTNRESNK